MLASLFLVRFGKLLKEELAKMPKEEAKWKIPNQWWCGDNFLLSLSKDPVGEGETGTAIHVAGVVLISRYVKYKERGSA